jgi:hypothetical protein
MARPSLHERIASLRALCLHVGEARQQVGSGQAAGAVACTGQAASP